MKRESAPAPHTPVDESAMGDGPAIARSAPLCVIGLSWLTMFFDGFDLVMFGTVIPGLLNSEPWGLTTTTVGVISSLALVGMIIGALVVGTLSNVVGRRWCALGSMLIFSAMMGLAVLAPSPEILGLTRFLAGIGLGGAMPTVSALTLEYTRPARRNFFFTLMFSGYSIGGVAAALIAIPVLPTFGWRAMFAIGALPLITLLPLTWRYLPESTSFLRSKGRHDEAGRLLADLHLHPETLEAASETYDEGDKQRAPVSELFRDGRTGRTVTLWAAMFCALLLIYGLTTWIPEIMRGSGYPLGSALFVLVAFNVGAAVGAVIGGQVADRYGTRTVLLVAFGAAALTLAALSFRLPLAVNLLLIAVAGFGSIGTANLMNVFVTAFYPARSHATALGWALGVGRIGAVAGPLIGGLLLATGLGSASSFYLFCVVAVLGAIAVAVVPRSQPES
ncbi:MFS transporter [Streptomyces mirabilis]|uniref:MFS transporter n=1 Tax=Streptomyces mirabilis TaxID=68239 RepID=UPI0036C7EBF5